MKLEAVFTIENNKLIKIADNSEVAFASLIQETIKWSTVEIEDENYNEEYLADLRNKLKAYDDQGKFAVLIPDVDKPLETAEQKELFINAFNHTARRIKDCVSVAGFVLPQPMLGDAAFIQDFMDTLAIKHAQYVYFVNKADAENAGLSSQSFFVNLGLFN